MLPANASKFTFELIGLADSLRVLKFTGEEAISTPYVFTIDIVSENFDLTADQFLEKAGVLTLVDDKLDNRLVHGEVIQFHTQGHGDRFANYRVILVPKCQFMALKENTRIFQEKTIPTILKEVLGGSGISGYNAKFALSGNYPKRNYCVQYNETDLAFVERLMSEEGMFYFFEHHLDHHCMVISDRNSVFGPIAGNKAIPFHAKTGMAQATDSIYGFTHRTKVQTRVKCSNCSNRIGKVPPDGICPECGTRPALWEGYSPQNVTLGDFNPNSTQVGLGHQLNPDGDLERYQYPGHFETPDQAKKYTKIHLEADCVDLITGEGQTQCVRLLPGKLLTIKQHFTSVFNRPYLLTKVIHEGLQPQSLEEGSSNRGTEYQSTFYTMPNETAFRVQVHPKPKAYDHQTALVCGPGGEEIYTDNYGRIKVQFHWDLQGQMNDKSSLWIRVAQGFAGNGYGSMVVPRIGQEVIVQFEYGNPDRPIVTGSAFNTSNPVPEGLPFNKTRTVFRSNSSPGGDGHNELRIDDKKGKEQVYLHAEKDMDLRIKNDLKQHIQKDQHHIVTNQHNENIGKDKHLNVGGNSNLEVGDSLSIKVGKDLHLKSGNNHFQQAQQTHLKAATTLVVDGGMALTVKGGAGILFLSPAGVIISGPMVRINSGGGGVGAQSASPAAPAKPTPPVNDKAGKIAKPGSAMIVGGNGWMVTDHRKGEKITMPTDAELARTFQTATNTGHNAGNNTSTNPSNNAGSSGSSNQPSSANMHGMTPVQPIPTELETISIALTYEDIENTPAIEIPYKVTFKDGQERTGTLDKQGKAIETDAPVGGGIIEFGHNYNEAAVENERQSLYAELDAALNQSALNIRNSYKSALANNPVAEPTDDKTTQLREDFRKAVEAEIDALRERSDAYDALPFYEAAWENTKSAAEGVGKGVTEYIPDLGELGALIDVMDIDISVMVDALTTGDIDDLQRQFQAWKQRGDAGYDAASESMEVLILLLSDAQTRELLASLPQRFLEVTPTDELVEIGLAQATQTGIDAGAVVGATVLVGAVTGPGGAVAGAATAVATTARKAGKALEAVSTILSKLVKVLKKKRNKHQSGSIPNNKTPVPAGKKGGNKNTENKAAKPQKDAMPASSKKTATPEEKAFVDNYKAGVKNTGLTDDQLIQRKNDGKKLNPKTGRLHDPDKKKRPKPDVSAKVTNEKTIPLKDLAPEDRKKLLKLEHRRKAANKAKEDAIKEKQAASKDNNKEAEKSANNKMNRLSEEIGETSARATMKKTHPDFKEIPSSLPGRGKSGQFDQVYHNPKTGEVVTVEAKGGGAGRATRKADSGQHVEQGTPAYRESVTDNMNTQTKAAQRKSRNDQKAIDKNKSSDKYKTDADYKKSVDKKQNKLDKEKRQTDKLKDTQKKIKSANDNDKISSKQVTQRLNKDGSLKSDAKLQTFSNKE